MKGGGKEREFQRKRMESVNICDLTILWFYFPCLSVYSPGNQTQKIESKILSLYGWVETRPDSPELFFLQTCPRHWKNRWKVSITANMPTLILFICQVESPRFIHAFRSTTSSTVHSCKPGGISHIPVTILPLDPQWVSLTDSRLRIPTAFLRESRLNDAPGVLPSRLSTILTSDSLGADSRARSQKEVWVAFSVIRMFTDKGILCRRLYCISCH